MTVANAKEMDDVGKCNSSTRKFVKERMASEGLVHTINIFKLLMLSPKAAHLE